MFPPLVVLIGACLVAIGSRWPVLNMPVLGDVPLFEMDRTAAWTVCVSAALAVPLAGLRWRSLALAAVIVAMGALGWLFYELGGKLNQLKEAGMVSAVEQVWAATRIKPGAVCVGGGLLLQFITLMFLPKLRDGTAS